MSDYKLLINGELVDGEHSSEVVNPATGDVFESAPRASLQQLEQAVQAAKAAGEGWAAAPEQSRRDALLAIADEVQSRAAELAPIFVNEHGAPMKNAMLELIVFAMKLKGAAMQPVPVKKIEVGEGRSVEQRYRPLGVVAAIVPWNVPLILLGSKLGPALLLGNTVVVKPAPTTSLTTLKIGEIIAKHVPQGVVNIVSDDNDLGEHLSQHADVRMITFTGSTATGKKVMRSAAGSLKRLTLELGGNDPAVVMNDADIEDAAEKIFRQAMINSGQACVATKRVYVQSAVYDNFCEVLGQYFTNAKMDNGFVEGVEFGPLQNKQQYLKVKELLDDASKTGRIVAQGKVPAGNGYFIPPTLVADVKNGDRIVDEEQFGPVLPVVKFENVKEAADLANAGPYGLSASVFTGNQAFGYEFAQRIEAGTVTVNKVLEMHPMVPFGGAKESGIGVENAEEGLAQFSQLQIIDMPA